MQTTASATEKPAYLGLLNAISLAESRAGTYLRAWAEATDDPDFACVLNLVAARETSHGEVFCRRISELGYELRAKADPSSLKRLATLADPATPDLAKLPPEREQISDPFKELCAKVAAGEFDPMTANLLTWYVAEERDSAARLEEAYACVRAKANGGARKANGHATNGVGAESEAIMACMTAGFTRLEKSLDKLAKALK